MSRLDSMIRLNRWQLDEKRRRLVELETMAEDTRRRIGALEREMHDEAQVSDADAGRSHPGSWQAYAQSVRERRENLEVTLATIEAQVGEMNEQIAAAFQELKKFELISEARAQRARETTARREQFALDEMALVAFRRTSAI